MKGTAGGCHWEDLGLVKHFLSNAPQIVFQINHRNIYQPNLHQMMKGSSIVTTRIKKEKRSFILINLDFGGIHRASTCT